MLAKLLWTMDVMLWSWRSGCSIPRSFSIKNKLLCNLERRGLSGGCKESTEIECIMDSRLICWIFLLKRVCSSYFRNFCSAVCNYAFTMWHSSCLWPFAMHFKLSTLKLSKLMPSCYIFSSIGLFFLSNFMVSIYNLPKAMFNQSTKTSPFIFIIFQIYILLSDPI